MAAPRLVPQEHGDGVWKLAFFQKATLGSGSPPFLCVGDSFGASFGSESAVRQWQPHRPGSPRPSGAWGFGGGEGTVVAVDAAIWRLGAAIWSDFLGNSKATLGTGSRRPKAWSVLQ